MSISQIINEKAGLLGSVGFRNSNWYTDSLLNELETVQHRSSSQADTHFIEPGDLVFFLYSAKYPQKYRFWDQHPLAYVLEINPRKGLFLGANLHYLNPSYRGSYALSLLNKEGEGFAPRKTLKNYLFANIQTTLYKVPTDDWEGVSLLPTEKFVDRKGRSISNHIIWDYPDSISSI